MSEYAVLMRPSVEDKEASGPGITLEKPIHGGFYALRDESGLPVIVGCVIIDNEGNIARGMAFYKYEPGWPCLYDYGARGALWNAIKAMTEKRNVGHFNFCCQDQFEKTKKGAILPAFRDATKHLEAHNMQWIIDTKGVIRRGFYNPPILCKKEKRIIKNVIRKLGEVKH